MPNNFHSNRTKSNTLIKNRCYLNMSVSVFVSAAIVVTPLSPQWKQRKSL